MRGPLFPGWRAMYGDNCRDAMDVHFDITYCEREYLPLSRRKIVPLNQS